MLVLSVLHLSHNAVCLSLSQAKVFNKAEVRPIFRLRAALCILLLNESFFLIKSFESMIQWPFQKTITSLFQWITH